MVLGGGDRRKLDTSCVYLCGNLESCTPYVDVNVDVNVMW